MADAAQQNNPDFFDAEVQARELEQQVMAAEDARKTKTAENVRSETEKALTATWNISTEDFKRMMDQYSVLIELGDEAKIKEATDKMNPADRKMLKKVVEFKMLLEKTDNQIRERAAMEEVRLLDLERGLFADLEGTIEVEQKPVEIEEEGEKEAVA